MTHDLMQSIGYRCFYDTPCVLVVIRIWEWMSIVTGLKLTDTPA